MQWHNGTWHNDMMDDGKLNSTMAQGTWLDVTMARWHKGSLVQCDGTTVNGSMGRWLDGTMSRWKVDGIMA